MARRPTPDIVTLTVRERELISARTVARRGHPLGKILLPKSLLIRSGYIL